MGEREHRLFLASRLASGNATMTERDEALAEVLLSLWSDKDLDERIDRKVSACKADGCGKRLSLFGVLKAIGLFIMQLGGAYGRIANKGNV